MSESDYIPGVVGERPSATSASAKPQRAAEVFQSTSVRTVFPSKKVLTCRDDETVDKAFKTLIDARVLSVPVYSRAHRRYVGLLDMLDFVSYINKHFKRDEVDQVVDLNVRFSSVKVAELSNVSERNPWYPVDGGAPLRKLLDTVCHSNIHRVPILDSDGDFYGIVSQTDLLKYVASSLNTLFASLGHLSIEKDHVGSWGKVHSITTKDTALAAFQVIHDLKVQGIAVVDAESGRLVGNISASDLRVIGHEAKSLSVLYQSCADFVQSTRAASHIKRILSVKRTATFAEVVHLFDAERAHRVYVVDDAQVPVAVVSTVDLLKRVQSFLDTHK